MIDDPGLESIFNRYVHGTTAVEDMERLNARLRTDAGARRAFVEILNLDSAIAAIAAGWMPQRAGQRMASRPLPARAAIRFPFPSWIAAAASLTLLVGGISWWFAQQRAFATVQKSAGVAEIAIGASLGSETHDIRAGTLALVTTRGARVVIEAPAEFRFESPQRLRMMRGRLAAEVPPSAKGFTVVTPSGDAVDLGTRFGVDVPADGPAEIHVFQGEVIARASGATAQHSVREGDAVSMEQGTSAARELRSSAFIQSDEMPGLAAGLAAGQRAQSELALTALRKDPALIALLDFESGDRSPGVYRVVQGRWPGSHAPEFVNPGDHLKLNPGGDRSRPQLTLAAWVRIDRLGAPYQSLLHTDGWSRDNPGQVHWMINRNATMRLALINNSLAPGSDELQGFPDSRSPVLPERGRWIHLATVYDASVRTVRFHLNGRFDKETHQEIAHPARLGPAQLGNWDRQDRKLSGRVDELMILGRAMSDVEIGRLYEAGNPYR